MTHLPLQASAIAGLARRFLGVSRVMPGLRVPNHRMRTAVFYKSVERHPSSSPRIFAASRLTGEQIRAFRLAIDSARSSDVLEEEQREESTITGTVRSIIFENGSFKIAFLEDEESERSVKIQGQMPGIKVGDQLAVQGRDGHHSKHGKQFDVTSFRSLLGSLTPRAIADTTTGVEMHLAKRIINYADQHGFDRHDFVGGKTGNLEAVEGIGKIKARAIREMWKSRSPSTLDINDEKEYTLRQVIEFLSRYEVLYSKNLCQRIVAQCGTKSMELLQTDPYSIDCLGFRKADKIAMAIGFEKNDERRIRPGILFTLKEMVEHRKGDTAIVKAGLVSIVKKELKLCNEDNMAVEEAIIRLASEGEVICTDVDGQIYVQSASLAEAEDSIVESLNRIQQGESFVKSSEVDDLTALAETSVGYNVSESQRVAINEALDNKISGWTGGPGTGKTAVISALVSALEQKSATVALCAFTGAAAQRINNQMKKNPEALTIHKMLGWDGECFLYNKHNHLPADYVIVDEASMLGTRLLANLLEALPSNCHLVIVGDIDQLPSIEPGAVLSDIISSERFPVTRLDYVFRQGHGSSIIEAAMRINQGDSSLPEGILVTSVDEIDEETDFQLLETCDDEESSRSILEVYDKLAQYKFGSNHVFDTQILVPQYNSIVGIDSMNEKIQKRSSVPALKFHNDLFKVGDKVVQTKNDYDFDLRNGNIGVIKSLTEEESMVVTFADGREVDLKPPMVLSRSTSNLHMRSVFTRPKGVSIFP